MIQKYQMLTGISWPYRTSVNIKMANLNKTEASFTTEKKWFDKGINIHLAFFVRIYEVLTTGPAVLGFLFICPFAMTPSGNKSISHSALCTERAHLQVYKRQKSHHTDR